MAASRNSFRNSPPEDDDDLHPVDHTKINGMWAVLLCVFALGVFLALVSFDTGDLPAWTHFNSLTEPHNPARNFIGPVGAVLALAAYLFFGAAAYLLPAGMIWFGLVKLLGHGREQGKVLLGWGLLLLSSAAFLHVQQFVLHGPGTVFDQLTGSPGGFFGKAIGGMVLQSLLGQVGAILILLAIYLVALPLFTGLNPGQFARMSRRELREKMEQRRLAREAAQEEEEELAAGPIQTTRTPPRRRATPAATSDDSPAPAPAAELPLEFAPERRIIDSSVRVQNKSTQRSLLFPEKKVQPLESTQFPGYTTPALDILEWNDPVGNTPADKNELIEIQETIISTMATFGIMVKPGDITRGPTVTRYEVYPTAGLRVGRIANLEPDIARATCAERIHIIAPIPGKDTVGIEIANNKKVLVPLRELLEDGAFTSSKKKIPLAMGKDVYGNVIVGDLAAMPHLLVAGATGSGKSVCINSIIASMLFRFSPDELRLIMVDPKVVEMAEYNTLPHLVAPVVTDAKKVIQSLRWVVNEMERRYRMFAKLKVRNFDAFNNRPKDPKPEPKPAPEPESTEIDEEGIESIAKALTDGELYGREQDDDEEDDLIGRDPEDEVMPERIPYIVVIIDELADLMQTASADVEMLIARIAQKARAAGIHLIVATQTPRATVVTGVIKANIPCRIAFQVSSALDSRVILDQGGAEKLVGKGDMLYLPPGSAQLLRCQGAFITDEEVHRLVNHCSSQGEQKFDSRTEEVFSAGTDDAADDVSDEDEELLQKCIEVIIQEKRASTSLLQRRLRLGYTRAARMMDLLEQRGCVGPGEGAKPREVLIKG